MSYMSQTRLASDSDFIARSEAVLVEQSLIFKDSTEPDQAALAFALLRADPSGQYRRVFITILAASPGFASTAETPSGGVDASRISDADLLAATQAEFPTVAELFFLSTGSPRT